MQEPLVAIIGPTAVGKTKLSLTLAKRFNAEIISGDSMQVYKGMDVGTAKPTVEERNNIPHHMIDILPPEEEFSVAAFQARVDELIPKIINRNRLPMLVGGTGLYVKALIQGFIFPDMETDWKLRERLEAEAEEYGTEYVHNKLKAIDPPLAEKLHPNDLRRVIRGIEVYKQTGKTSTHFKKEAKERPPRYRAIKIGLRREREELYDRINRRVDIMIEEGLIEEVKELYETGYDRDLQSMQGLGYKEIIGYLEGEYDLKEAIRLIKRDTRHFAKRQLTWFRKDKEIDWFDVDKMKFEDLITQTEELIRTNLQPEDKKLIEG
ncbi:MULTISPECIES: tRNA (adenosine(37)-N6)-dimethylallyltransferase MiaA [unclassified Candidatus Frackibacter]|uniref:tRNA (adenosine(37)-N6)-dimethylallyltransferase MiaA n=1 Tax=unclassified Candidatus Frackibacter TaxID=2648818 RepID=UPI0008892D81|nr:MULTISPECIES: tRNA (adenosine(37)-N6)-dimethylallyltransferase MiaA [unclassified Candidatus Frackibacter]SDC26848.1 tRNA dimethylallyltransferase [Candidatus Frackibacter sp. WG11]SEM53853.1 tRNA dimethylallyltransferase [Candidatus Frackibacter sp. WG12]SFL54603.1 tRNA dimethylallyltransferase [Candidatus Frackibacter sp. WG13]